MGNKTERNDIYVDNSLQFKFVTSLVILCTIEVSIFAGCFYWIMRYQRQNIAPDSRLLFIYMAVLILLLLLSLINVYIGILLSHKVSGPLVNFLHVIQALSQGDISKHVTLRDNDFFSELESEFNAMVSSLSEMVQADRAKKESAVKLLSESKRSIASSALSKEEKKKLKASLSLAIEALSKIGHEFILHPVESHPENTDSESRGSTENIE